ncbi:hypothetical protein BDA99DRAFT_554487 [Phascolomyces articulosus]|uniref:Uncharacterized protein n=1 Tax=Phascolomyces articulosus TaxID=60185 RepID=A0AAD5KSH1_9FUNG|nr:hypothetical protein BDA99DRAFT_554485 [Phascolomyces articulosus]KAI9278887.1 hypothetical protein BDA99DRAFT_554487 [Phascolomyces articulosus]
MERTRNYCRDVRYSVAIINVAYEEERFSTWFQQTIRGVDFVHLIKLKHPDIGFVHFKTFTEAKKFYAANKGKTFRSGISVQASKLSNGRFVVYIDEHAQQGASIASSSSSSLSFADTSHHRSSQKRPQQLELAIRGGAPSSTVQGHHHQHHRPQAPQAMYTHHPQQLQQQYQQLEMRHNTFKRYVAEIFRSLNVNVPSGRIPDVTNVEQCVHELLAILRRQGSVGEQQQNTIRDFVEGLLRDGDN